MLRHRRVIGLGFLRGATLALVVAMAGASAWLACDSGSASTGTSELDVGPTFGLEVVVSVKGRGRVVSVPAAIDCPTKCFARVVLADPTIDGSAAGLQLGAEENLGSHFVGWRFESVNLGVAARGPSQCSPMKRWSSVLTAEAGAVSHFQTLAFGETEGTPPLGLEAECAPYTRVPVAYAITAVFEENDVRPVPPPPPGAPVEVLFEPPALGVTVGKEIGIVDGKVYWRFNRGKDSEPSAPSGIAMGKADGSGGGSTLIVPPNDRIGRVLFGPTIILQHTNTNLVETILAATNARFQFFIGGTCLGFATDGTTGYCRYSSGSTTYLVSWLFGASSYTFLYQLGAGYEIAVDGPDVYYSEEQTGGEPGMGFIDRAPRFVDAGFGFPVATRLVAEQTSPRDLVLGDANLFWLDRVGNQLQPTSAPRNDGGAALRAGFDGTTFAVDAPDAYYIAQAGAGVAGWSILRASVDGVVSGFRFGLRPIGGLAVDASHVYWTGDDGRVYRAPKL